MVTFLSLCISLYFSCPLREREVIPQVPNQSTLARPVPKSNSNFALSGNYYKCPDYSEPDIDAYRVQANIHERKCTYGKPSIQVPMDPCIEAEIAPIEYSFHDGWMFCLGSGERDSNYFQNGTLDCGNKTKVRPKRYTSNSIFLN